MENTCYYAPANFSNDTFNDETVNTTDVMNQIDSGIMIDENTKLINVDNTYNDLLILKHDLLKYLKNDKIYFDEELDINIEKVETKSNVLVDALSEFFKEFKIKRDELVKDEKELIEEIEKTKDDINIIKGMMEKTKKMMEKYDLNKDIIDTMGELGKSIREKSNINTIKEKYIKSRKDILIYLDVIKSINSLNLGNTCSLCLMNNVDVYFQNCGHTACQDCADKLLEYDGGIDKARCSFCRKDIFKINKLYYI
tara:strand:+ start:808 stop:1569 length:762 start_codon:yes stop_codon:yes gene_type:complete